MTEAKPTSAERMAERVRAARDPWVQGLVLRALITKMDDPHKPDACVNEIAGIWGRIAREPLVIEDHP